MINAVNALLECFVTALFTAGLLVGCTKLGWFPVIIMQVMTPEEAAAMEAEEEEDEQE